MLIRRFMQAFFRLLYHPFAFTYDIVAAVVSLGQWKDWVYSILPFIEGTRILELGHGPGHLQRILLNRNLVAVAIDESAQMGRLAKRRIGDLAKLTRGIVQQLPFASETFDAVVATFPTEYIYNPRTLSDAKRVLRNGGRLVVLPVAWPKSRWLTWLFKITGEIPSNLSESLKSKIREIFVNAGFDTEIQIVEVRSSALLIVIAKRPFS